MRLAIDEARMSLREGNCGFGAVIVKDDRLVAKARDAEKTDADPTAHAEITAIRMASAKWAGIYPGLRFTRNYERLRPHAPYCEEIIRLDERS